MVKHLILDHLFFTFQESEELNIFKYSHTTFVTFTTYIFLQASSKR